MKTTLSKWFGSSGSGKQGSSRDAPQTGFDDGGDAPNRRHLVQVALREALRRHGIPPQWIECQTLMVASRSRGPGMYVRLVVRHWDPRLMTYAFALQNVLLQDVAQADPRAPEWLHGISWQLEYEDSCPHSEMPEKTFWLTPSLAGSSEAFGRQPHISFQNAFEPTQPASVLPYGDSAAAEAEAQQDLARLFMIRDQELGKAVEPEPSSFAKTTPTPLGRSGPA